MPVTSYQVSFKLVLVKFFQLVLTWRLLKGAETTAPKMLQTVAQVCQCRRKELEKNVSTNLLYTSVSEGKMYIITEKGLPAISDVNIFTISCKLFKTFSYERDKLIRMLRQPTTNVNCVRKTTSNLCSTRDGYCGLKKTCVTIADH